MITLARGNKVSGLTVNSEELPSFFAYDNFCPSEGSSDGKLNKKMGQLNKTGVLSIFF